MYTSGPKNFDAVVTKFQTEARSFLASVCTDLLTILLFYCGLFEKMFVLRVRIP